ncbi:MarR family winged helix-turn-helix transcriptional regulator [Fundidesulfovibrio putealis]|uniref:MarR family winged helix-turn-helix transcriptional regulator n=1 Tax=Fundidesulfovibrio putealis TaxID=270496 RepID=UPI000420CF70|nr:MarR family transcriptional regulator [Fundidesulfovibrio putealis]
MPYEVNGSLTRVCLAVFRLNGALLEAGDELGKPLLLTSARWQVLGALALSDVPLTAPRIAQAMGLTRQGVQKQLNALAPLGYLEKLENDDNRRSPLFRLSDSGRRTYQEMDALYRSWATELVQGLCGEDLARAARTLEELADRVKSGCASNAPYRGRSES